MKKVFSTTVFFIIMLLGFSLYQPQKTLAAECTGININGKSLSNINNGDTITLKTLTDTVHLEGEIEFANECFIKGAYPIIIRGSLGVKITSELYTVQGPYTNAYITVGGAESSGVQICKQIKKIETDKDVAQWTCTVDVYYTGTIAGKDAGAPGSFSKKIFNIETSRKDIEINFNNTISSITFKPLDNPIIGGECSIDNVSIKTFNGTSESSSFSLNTDGTFPSDAFGRLYFNTTTGCIKKFIYLKVASIYIPDIVVAGSVPPTIETIIHERNVSVSQTTQFADFKPLYFDGSRCNKLSDEASGAKKYRCTLKVKADSNQTGIFNKTSGSVAYTVIIPTTVDASTLKINPQVVNTNIGGVNVGSFGSNTIKEGFSWDPCYSSKTKKIQTYRNIDTKPEPVDITKLTPDEISKGLDECYTLLSNLPIKLAGSDPVSAKIGYVTANDKDGKILPGLVKTVIVGKFFIGDFVVYLFKLFMGIAGLVAIAVLIYIGIMIITNKENPYQLKVLKEWLGRVFIAIGILLGSFIILSIIDPKLTDFNFGITDFNLSEQGFPDITFETSYNPVTGKKQTIKFADAYKIAKEAEAQTGIPAAFIIATLQQESGLGGNIGKCNVPGTPGWREIMTNSKNGQKDQNAYEIIMKALGRSTENQPLSCPSGGGRGGAMGPLQFIASTWINLADETTMLLKKANLLKTPVADPWEMSHAIFAASVLYKMNGANSSLSSLRNAACKYYSGDPCQPGRVPPNEFYGNEVVQKAKQAQADIDLMLAGKK